MFFVNKYWLTYVSVYVGVHARGMHMRTYSICMHDVSYFVCMYLCECKEGIFVLVQALSSCVASMPDDSFRHSTSRNTRNSLLSS